MKNSLKKKPIKIQILQPEHFKEWFDLELLYLKDTTQLTNNSPFINEEITNLNINYLWKSPINEDRLWSRVWGIFYSNKLIGFSELTSNFELNRFHRINFSSFFILEEHRGKGFIKHLNNLVLDWCKSKPSIHLVDIRCLSNDEYKKSRIKEMNFEKYAVQKDAVRIDGKPVDETFLTLNVKK